MAYNNYNNYNNKGNNEKYTQVNVTTKGPKLYNLNKDVEENSSLILNLWNDGAIIKIHPALEQVGPKGERIDYNSELTIMLNLKNLYKLRKGMAALLTKGSKYGSVGVDSTGKDGVRKRLLLSKGLFTEDDRLVISIFTLKKDSEVAETVLNYIFNFKGDDDYLIVDYNPETGDYKKVWINPEPSMFSDWLNDACQALRGATSHEAARAIKQVEVRLETKIEGNMGSSSRGNSNGGGRSFNGLTKKRNLGISREDFEDDNDSEIMDIEDSAMANVEEIDDLSDLGDLLED